MPEADRCGFHLELGLSDGHPDTEQCDRPTWEDHDNCVWHAEVDGKTVDSFGDSRPTSGENLDGAYLREASLVGVDWFAGTSMVGADLTGARVNGADFSDANLMLSRLSDTNAINATFDGANLEGTTFTNADLRRATLEDALLNEAVFQDVHVGAETRFGDVSVYERDGVEPELSDDHPLEAAAWAYRQLQQIYQRSALPELARRSYNQEKDARRRLDWAEGNYVGAIKRELSRWVMRHGSSPYRVLAVSLLVVVVAAVLFPLTGGIQEIQGERVITYSIENPEDASQWWITRVLFKSLYFSIVTFATLGYGDIQPIGGTARLLASVETVIGSLLSALLVFVLARSVTW